MVKYTGASKKHTHSGRNKPRAWRLLRSGGGRGRAARAEKQRGAPQGPASRHGLKAHALQPVLLIWGAVGESETVVGSHGVPGVGLQSGSRSVSGSGSRKVPEGLRLGIQAGPMICWIRVEIWPWVITYSILGMNIYLPPILMFTRGTGF